MRSITFVKIDCAILDTTVKSKTQPSCGNNGGFTIGFSGYEIGPIWSPGFRIWEELDMSGHLDLEGDHHDY